MTGQAIHDPVAFTRQMRLVAEGIVTAVLMGATQEPERTPFDEWDDVTRVLVGELARIEWVTGSLPPTPQAWVDRFRAGVS